jgi:hypothetical protein
MTRRRSLETVVAQGDFRVSLEALRNHLAAELDQSDGRGTAALAKQLTDVLKAIAALPSGKERTIDDELAQRRKDRMPAADVSDRAERRRVEGNRRSSDGRPRRTGS